MSQILCVIQARMGSRRLPGKVLMPVGGVPLIEIAWRKACEAFGEENVVIATPECTLDDALGQFLSQRPFRWYAHHGSEDDVLGRFFNCAVWSEATTDTIFRLTPDDHRKSVPEMIRVASGESGIPVEVGGEAFTFAQLKEWHETVTDPFLREHIGLLITPNPVAPPDDGLPWSIDCQRDLDLANGLVIA